MLLPKMPRPVSALVLVTGLVLTLPGCGGDKPATEKEKKTDPAPALNIPPVTNPNTNPNTTPDPNATPKIDQTFPKPPERIDLTVGVGKEATDFLKALGDGNVKADRLSAGFTRAIGLPAEFPSDKARGFSTDAAEAWLRRIGRGPAGTGISFSLPFISKQVGDVALFRGTFVGQSGSYALRMIKDGAAWKVDWLSLSSAEIRGTTSGPSGDAACQEFAATGVMEVVTDKDAMPKDDRAVAIAAGMTPTLRGKLAEPFGTDKDQGFDYNRGKLLLEAGKYGSGAESFTLTQQGDTPAFRVEITRSGGAKSAYLVKLVKGTTPGQWLVDEILPL